MVYLEAVLEHMFGINEYQYRQKNIKQQLIIKTAELIKSHLLMAVMSGTGKIHQAKRLINTVTEQGRKVDIIDVHNELEQAELKFC